MYRYLAVTNIYTMMLYWKLLNFFFEITGRTFPLHLVQLITLKFIHFSPCLFTNL